jgi:hypothetical protein
MPRRARTIVGGYAYHILNRANGRLPLFKKDPDFAAFEATALGTAWAAHVNAPQSDSELPAIRRCAHRGQPFGSDKWTAKAASQIGLEHTFRPRGRPKKPANAGVDNQK